MANITDTHRVGGLDVSEDIDYQRRAWRVQRVGWVVWAGVLVAAMAGLFGHGPLSAAHVQSASGAFAVAYARLARHSDPMLLQIRLAPGAAPQGEARIWLDRTYLAGAEVQSIFPEPERVEAGPDRMTYVFTVDQPDHPTTIAFHVTYEGMGATPVRVGLDGGEAVQFTQFVYP